MQFSVSEDMKSIVKCLVDLVMSFEEQNKLLQQQLEHLKNIGKELSDINHRLHWGVGVYRR